MSSLETSANSRLGYVYNNLQNNKPIVGDKQLTIRSTKTTAPSIPRARCLCSSFTRGVITPLSNTVCNDTPAYDLRLK